MKKIIVLIISILMLTACGNTYTTVNDRTAVTIFGAGDLIIDVRTPKEYNEGHIENAINIPVEEIGNITYPKDKKMMVYCASGVRSTEAAKVLIDNGYTNVYNLDGGLINWGYELETEE